jgi:hypothetical protein
VRRGDSRRTHERRHLQDGQDGKNGVDGINGTQILNGSDTPTSAQGSVNDYYIDSSTTFLYKKVGESTGGSLGNGWNFFCSLKGLDGTNGTNGSDGSNGCSIYRVSTKPVGVAGYQNGDWALLVNPDIGQEANEYHLYQLQNGIWIDYGSLRGATGEPGATGADGKTGSYTKATMVEIPDQAVSLNMEQSVYYSLTNTNLTAITLSLGSVEEGTVGEFICEFVLTNESMSIILPEGVNYANGWTRSDYMTGKKYIIYIVNNIAYVNFVEV